MIAPAHATSRGSIAGTGGIEFFPVSHVSTFMGSSSTSASTYRDYDIAMRNNMTNARVMREDCSIMECLEARQRAVALLKWHIEPEDDKSPEQKDLATELQRIMACTPRFTEFRRSLLEAIWYGKSAIQMHYTRTLVNGWMRTAVCRGDDNPDSLAWTPIHGDKIVFRNDDMTKIRADEGQFPFQLGIRIGSSWVGRLPNGYQPERISTRYRAESIDRGMAYFLRKEDRHRIIVHKHMIEDGAYEDLLAAGSIHGVGVRSRIYWDWVQKQEIQAMLMAYIERTHGGIEIYRYPMGNPEGKKEAEKAIHGRVPGRAALLVPVPAGEDAYQYGVELIEPGMAGVSVLQDLLGSFFGHRIKRYILGQTLSTEADATGLGSGVADLHLESFLQIVEYDATNLEETITEEMLRRLQHNNFPASRGIRLKFKIDTQDADTQKKIAALQDAWNMNARIPEREVFDAVGISPPTESDRILPGPSGGQGGPSPFPPPGPPHGASVSVPQQIAGDAPPEQFQAAGEPERYGYAAREPDLRSAIEKAAGETDTDPSEAQRMSGNYRKGQFHWNGWTVAIENPAGSVRSGRNSLGVEWSHKMPVHYGYFRRTESDADGDHLDVFVGPDPESPVVFIVDQAKGNGRFDEHKALIGFLSEKEAIAAYKGSYSPGWNGLKNITALTVPQFRAWLEDGDTGQPIAGQVSRYSQMMFNWDESEHPRDEAGKFTERSDSSQPRRQLRDGQVEMRQAKTGGETSDVDGKFYKGGQWMPVHGLSVKSDAEKKPPKKGDGGPPIALESSRPTARSMSPEQIEAERERLKEERDWDAIRNSNLGYVLGLGDRPHNIKHGSGSLTKWVDLIRDSRVTDETLDEVAEAAEALARSAADKERRIINGKFHGDKDAVYGVQPVTDEEWTFEQDRAADGAKDDIEWVSKRADRKILKQHPQIAKARAWVMWMIHYDQSLETLKKVAEVIGQQVSDRVRSGS